MYLTTWANPHPTKKITTINFVSTEQTATPFCVAITVQTVETDVTEHSRDSEDSISESQERLSESKTRTETQTETEIRKLDISPSTDH